MFKKRHKIDKRRMLQGLNFMEKAVYELSRPKRQVRGRGR